MFEWLNLQSVFTILLVAFEIILLIAYLRLRRQIDLCYYKAFYDLDLRRAKESSLFSRQPPVVLLVSKGSRSLEPRVDELPDIHLEILHKNK